MIISGEEQNPLKCLSSFGAIWKGINLILGLLYPLLCSLAIHATKPTRVDEILDYLEGRNNVKIKFYLSAVSASSKALAIDTLGNFSTDCTGIEYHAKSYTDFDHLLMEILPFSSFVTGEPPANPFTD